MTTRAEFVAEVRKWIGTPFHHEGRALGVGCDCAGPLIEATRALGLADVVAQNYPKQPTGHALEAYCDAHMVRIDPGSVQPGDVGVFRYDGDPTHIAIFADHPNGGLSIIHALGRSGRGKVIEQRFTPDDKTKRLAVAYRIPGLE